MAMDDDELSTLIRQQATRYKASASLKADIRTRAVLENAARPVRAPVKRFDWISHFTEALQRLLAGWRYVTVGATGGIAVTVAMGFLLSHMPMGEPNSRELVAAHVSALKADHLVQVVSTDQHTVKPWFQGKLDYSPPVLDLSSMDFSLLGGRVDHIAGESVAALAYSHNKHILNVFVWPSSKPQAVEKTQFNGFNVSHWSDGAMQYGVVSDLEASEIEKFGTAWRGAIIK